MRLSIAELRSEFRRRIAARPPVVVALVLVHGFILLQAALPNLLPGLAAAWGWSRFDSLNRSTPAALFPSLGLTTLAWAICFAGLWYGKGWPWFLALYLDVSGILSIVLSLSRWYSVRTAIPWAPLYTSFNLPLLMVMCLEWLSFILLFHLEARRHYGIQSFDFMDANLMKAIAAVRRLEPVASALDRVMVRSFAACQLLLALTLLLSLGWWILWIFQTPLGFAYVLYIFVGIFSVRRLWKITSSARTVSLLWFSLFVGVNVMRPMNMNWEGPNGPFLGYCTIFAAFAVLYLSCSLSITLFCWFRENKWGLILKNLNV